MKICFTRLFKYINTYHQLKKEKQVEQMQKIWQESSQIQIPDPPPAENEWLKVERAINIAEKEKIKVTILQQLFSSIFKTRCISAYALALLVFITFLIIKQNSLNIYCTAYGEKLTVSLPDSSRITLNAGSCLKYARNFNSSSRRIELEGEAYCQVRKGNLSFIVHTGIADVRVLGTQFNVYNRNNQLQVAVNEGIVAVSSKAGEKDSTVIIRKGQFMICPAGEYPGDTQTIKYKQYPGWLHGHLIFDQSTFRWVCDEIERQFNINIKCSDTRLNQSIVSGMFKTSNFDSLMTSICVLVQKHYKIEDNIVIID